MGVFGMDSHERGLAVELRQQAEVREYGEPKVSLGDDGTATVAVPLDPDSQLNRSANVADLVAAMARLGYAPAGEVSVREAFPFGMEIRGTFRSS